ncbi:MAG: gluconate 2-dehydrogenase subunit 3 family protein [Bacteroidetes bacterium]|nr:gluconate 2-dehydrogenase subunit 3 family protein [Bacteroidota bacterium]
MDRRKYLKSLAVGTIGAGALISCGPDQTKKEEDKSVVSDEGAGPNRQPDEIEHYRKISAEKFFTDHELKTITILSDIIIPQDEVSGSASQAGVPAFIEFIAKDMPHHQTPLRGGMRWLDVQCLKLYGATFADCNAQQQISIVDEIAYPEKVKPGMEQGVAFFNLMRDLTAAGFFSSQIGIKDLGYAGNQPNQWDGVPQDVLDQYGVKYDERTLKESVKFD